MAIKIFFPIPSAARLVTFCATAAIIASAAPTSGGYNAFVPKSFVVSLSDRVPHMLNSIKNTLLPDQPEYPTLGSSAGISLDTVKQLRDEWINDFSWHEEQANLNK